MTVNAVLSCPKVFGVVLLLAALAVYLVAWVIFHARKSSRQWREVDRSKLKEWEDDDEW